MRRALIFILTLLHSYTYTLSGTASAAEPDLIILSPAKGQIFPGHELSVQFHTPDFTLPKLGHIHIWLDDIPPTKTSAIKVYSSTHTLTNLKYGYHTLTAELVRPDHSSFTPALISSVTFKLNPASMFPKNTQPVGLSPLHLAATTIILLAATFYLVSKQRESFKKTPVRTIKSKSKKH